MVASSTLDERVLILWALFMSNLKPLIMKWDINQWILIHKLTTSVFLLCFFTSSDERTDAVLFNAIFLSEGGFSWGPGCNREPDASLNLCWIVLEFFDSAAGDKAVQLILELPHINKRGRTYASISSPAFSTIYPCFGLSQYHMNGLL